MPKIFDFLGQAIAQWHCQLLPEFGLRQSDIGLTLLGVNSGQNLLDKLRGHRLLGELANGEFDGVT